MCHYIITQFILAFWLVLSYDLLEDSARFKLDRCVILWTNHNSLLSIATNQFASFCVDNRSRQSAICASVKVVKFEIKKGFFSVYFDFSLYKTNRFDVAVRLFSNRSQRTSKCGENISDTLGCASCATFLFLPHFDLVCDLLLKRGTATWNLFVKPWSNGLASSRKLKTWV